MRNNDNKYRPIITFYLELFVQLIQKFKENKYQILCTNKSVLNGKNMFTFV